MPASDGIAQIETGYIDVGGIRTFYRRVPGDGPPAVFFHGVPTHSEDFMPFLEAMEGPALAFDLPGFGRADRPDPSLFDYSMWSHAAFVGDALDALGVGDHSLVVHDWGGVGLIAAQAHPDRIRRVVLMNCLPLLPGYRWHRTARIWRAPVLGELSTRIWNRRLADYALRESRGDRSHHDPEFVDMVWDHIDRGTLDGILRLYRSGDPEELVRAGERLGELDCPSLVVWAGRDPYISARFGRAYAEVLGAELAEYPEAGHWLWRDEPEVIPLVAKFLAPG